MQRRGSHKVEGLEILVAAVQYSEYHKVPLGLAMPIALYWTLPGVNHYPVKYSERERRKKMIEHTKIKKK